MADYKEEEVAGKKWTRVVRLQIDNPRPSLNQPATLMLVEEEVTQVSGTEVTRLVDNIHITFDPAKPRHQQLYALLNEEYVEGREIRDAAKAAEAQAGQEAPPIP